MIEAEPFALGLGRIALSLRQAYTPQEQLVYFEAIGPQTDAAEWERFTRAAVASSRWPKWLPNVAELLDALREFRGAPSLDAEAVAAYERVIGAGVYTPEGGTSWHFRAVREACGSAAAMAFLEAGGHHAFASSYRESDRRERFVRAYVAEVRERPQSRLLPAGADAMPTLEAVEPPSQAEAAQAMRRIRAIAESAGASE